MARLDRAGESDLILAGGVGPIAWKTADRLDALSSRAAALQ
jgi:hypothetical protein